MNWSAIGAGGLATAVVMGAFGAHALRNRLDAYSLTVYERAAFYHFVHAMALLVIPLFSRAGLLTHGAESWVGWLLFSGILLFSGSLYALAMTGVRTLGAVTPFGGLAFILAWIVLAAALFRGVKS